MLFVHSYPYHWLKERWVFYVSWVLVPWIQHTVRCLERIPARISSLKATRKQVNIQLTSCWAETRKVSGHLATNLGISPPKIYILILIERKSLWKEFFHFNFTMKFKEVRFKWQYQPTFIRRDVGFSTNRTSRAIQVSSIKVLKSCNYSQKIKLKMRGSTQGVN